MIRLETKNGENFLVVDDWDDMEIKEKENGDPVPGQRHIYRADDVLAGKVTGFDRDTEKATMFLAGRIMSRKNLGQTEVQVFLKKRPKKNRFEMALKGKE